MAAPKGNQFWKLRSKHGPDELFACPDKLWESCVEYFEWCEANPLLEEKGFAFQGVVTKETFGKMRAMTIGGLCLYLGITEKTWREWRSTRDDLSSVITRAEAIMDYQKLTGAAADLLNPNIIARLMGLKDETKLEHSGSIDLSGLSDEQLNARIQSFLSKANG